MMIHPCGVYVRKIVAFSVSFGFSLLSPLLSPCPSLPFYVFFLSIILVNLSCNITNYRVSRSCPFTHTQGHGLYNTVCKLRIACIVFGQNDFQWREMKPAASLALEFTDSMS